MFSGLRRLQADLPFPILGLDSDNGGEFINRLLIGYCADQGITFTRGRPFAKNDSCHIETKELGRRPPSGWLRSIGTAGPALERMHDLARDYVNFLHPVSKLTSKTREGARVRRSYDAASTPFHRLVDSGALSIQMTRELKARSANVDPIRLKLHLEAAQRTLAARAARSDSYVRQP